MSLNPVSCFKTSLLMRVGFPGFLLSCFGVHCDILKTGCCKNALSGTAFLSGSTWRKFNESEKEDTSFLLKDYNKVLYFLFQENSNVFLVDWTGGSGGRYAPAIQNARVTGREVGYFIQFLHNHTAIPLSRVHLMGDSFGAQAAGFAGETQPGIGRISGNAFS